MHSRTLSGPLVFSALAVLGAWLVMAPVWIALGGDSTAGSAATAELADPAGALDEQGIRQILLFQLGLTGMMMTPALAAWATLRWVHGVRFRSMLAVVGLVPAPVSGARRHPLVSQLRWALIAIAGTIALVVVSVAVAALLGVLDLDWSFPILAESSAQSGLPTGVIALIQFASVPIAAVVPNALLAAGEEIGWRGYLMPTLQQRWGTAVAVLGSGAIWGAWHAPVILLGFNFDRPNIGGVLLMVAGGIAVGAWLSWLALRARAVWPAVFAHGAMNAAAGLYLLVSATPEVDGAFAGPLGVAGWIAFGLTGTLLLVLLGRRQRAS